VTNWASRLRVELSRRARDFAATQGVPSYESVGAAPTILFPADPSKSRHGNFIDVSYRAILANPLWAERLKKTHSQSRALPRDRQADAKELDSCNSSDALLMNCFCYPTASTRICRRLLPMLPSGDPEFGVAGNVPLQDGSPDTTELDMRAGRVIFESKLTETDFTERPRAHVERYRGLSEVFDVAVLPQTAAAFQGYQLIRNVLAAAAHGYHFVLLCDGRRPALLHEWWQVHAAIRTAPLRKRCGFLLWQEVADASPAPLQEFLQVKYGF
jgi:Restriction Endonuclease associating with ARP